MAKKNTSSKPKAEKPKAVTTGGAPMPAPKKSALLKVKDTQTGAVTRMKPIAWENVKNEVIHRENKEIPRYVVIEGE